MSADILALLANRVSAARDGLQASDLTQALPPGVDIITRDVVGALECLLALAIHAEPVKHDAGAIVLDGERVELPQPAVSPEVRAFHKIATFIGAAGYEGGADAATLMTEIAAIVAAVPGVPDPLAEGSEDHYRTEAMRKLTRRQRRMLGIRGGGRND